MEFGLCWRRRHERQARQMEKSRRVAVVERPSAIAPKKTNMAPPPSAGAAALSKSG
jgi:hypothetical protein